MKRATHLLSCLAATIMATGFSAIAAPDAVSTSQPQAQTTPAGAQAPSSTPGSAATMPPALKLDQLMEKYVNAVGGRELLRKISTTVSVSTFSVADRTITVTTTVKAPFYFLQAIAVQGSNESLGSVGFDGKTAWSQDPGGAVTTLTGQKRAEVIADAVGANNSEIFPERWPTTVALKPSEIIGGSAYYVIAIQPQGGIPHDILLDPQTFRPIIDRTLEPGEQSVSIVTRFGKGPLGELIPMVGTTTSSTFPTTTSTTRSVHDNVTVPNSKFAPPLGKATESA